MGVPDTITVAGEYRQTLTKPGNSCVGGVMKTGQSRMRKGAGTFVAVLGLLMMLLPGQAAAGTNLLYILDASNSMWGQAGGQSKIATAKRVMEQSLATLADSVTPGLMLYGHRRRNDCSDVELVAPLGTASRGQLTTLIQKISPKGKTPIARALEMAGKAFAGRLEDNNAVLLISDGIATCGGDPCAVAEELAKRGIRLQINVVGLDVDKSARAQLTCIAKAGNGQYFDARNAKDFKLAIAKVQKQTVARKTPPKPAPKPKVQPLYFEDQFDGNALSADWIMLNPDPETYLVEDGVLTLVAHDGLPTGQARGVNVLSLKKPLPKGDWSATARILFAPQTMGERVSFGLAGKEDDGIFAQMVADTVNYDKTNINLDAVKISHGKRTGFSRTVYYVTGRNLAARGRFFGANITAVDLQLSKHGRKYTARMRVEPRPGVGGDSVPDGKWKHVQSLSSLRSPGDHLILSFGSRSSDYLPHGGEGVIRVDWIKISTP